MPKIVIFIMLSSLLLAGCGPKTVKDSRYGTGLQPTVQLAPPPQTSQAIQQAMNMAYVQDDIDGALQALELIAKESPGPLAEEASFRRSELLLRFQYPEALSDVRGLFKRYPNHALIPYAHMWLAKWWLEQSEEKEALSELRTVLDHKRLTRELADEAISLGATLARYAPETEAVEWYFSAARLDDSRRDIWLRESAGRASLDTISRLRLEGRLKGIDGEQFYLSAAKVQLMHGNMPMLQTITDMAAADMPDSPIIPQLRNWASGITRHATVGVLLPLSGKYAKYGQEALRGVRMAFAGLQAGDNFTLRIEDAASDPHKAVAAYKRLVSDGATMVIGPLLNECSEALLPYLKSDVPVLTLSANIELVEEVPEMFSHTLAYAVQARVMAEYAWREGVRKAVVISASDPSSLHEAANFRAEFKAFGGEISDEVTLTAGDIDHRKLLQKMRFHTDDEELLAVLEEELDISANPDMEIRMPVSFDGIYLALPGKMVAILAGQLAYVDVRGVYLYGSERWRDGHLLDDRGRYLSKSRFSDVEFPEGSDPEVRRFVASYHELWGSGKPDKLAGLTYDSVMIAAILTTKLGLSGEGLIEGLKDVNGFPGLTGHVQFLNSGIGIKSPKIFGIQRGRIVPAG